MCIHALYIFAPCGHHTFGRRRLETCSSYKALTDHTTNHASNQSNATPCQPSAHPFRSRLIHAYCTPCHNNQLRAEAERWTRLRSTLGADVPGFQRWADFYRASDLGELDEAGDTIIEGLGRSPLVKAVKVYVPIEERTVVPRPSRVDAIAVGLGGRKGSEKEAGKARSSLGPWPRTPPSWAVRLRDGWRGRGGGEASGPGTPRTPATPKAGFLEVSGLAS